MVFIFSYCLAGQGALVCDEEVEVVQVKAQQVLNRIGVLNEYTLCMCNASPFSDLGVLSVQPWWVFRCRWPSKRGAADPGWLRPPSTLLLLSSFSSTCFFNRDCDLLIYWIEKNHLSPPVRFTRFLLFQIYFVSQSLLLIFTWLKYSSAAALCQ